MKPNLVLFVMLFASAHVASADCAARLAEHFESDLQLTYEEFDQTDGQGFRQLEEIGCYKEGADLIEAYISESNNTQRSLRWHIAQLRAQDGDYPLAIEAAKAVLSTSEDYSTNPMRWNDYVLGTIAFLARDKDKLLFHRAQVLEGVEAYPNKINLKVLDSLIEHFDDSYATAYSKVRKG